MNSYRIVCIQQYRQSAATTTTPSIRNPSKPFHLLQTHRPIQSKRQSLRKVKPLTHSPSKIATTHRPATTMKHPTSTARQSTNRPSYRPTTQDPLANPRPLHQNSIDRLIRFSIPVLIPSQSSSYPRNASHRTVKRRVSSQLMSYRHNPNTRDLKDHTSPD